MRRVWCAGILGLAVAGCSTTADVSGGGTIRVADVVKPSGDATSAKNGVTIRVVPYADARNTGNPRKIGTGGQFVYGLNAPKGTDLLLDKDVAELVTRAMKQRLRDGGYQVVEEGSAHFEMSGAVNELTYNVTARDEVAIAVATEVKESGSGKLVWSGVVAEKKDRFPGVSGDDIGDVTAFLRVELGIVARKTNDAVGAILMAQRPDLFNLVPGTKAIPGVTVLSAPGLNVPAVNAAAASAPVAAPAAASAAPGILTVSTKPSHAKIYVGDVYYGRSPLRVELEPGIVEVSARLDGYKNGTEKVSVRKGETTEVELSLQK